MCLAGVDICIPQRNSTEPLRAGASKVPEIPSPAGNHAACTSLPRQVALCLHLFRGIFKTVATLILSPETEHLMCPFTLPNHRVPSTRPFKQLIKKPFDSSLLWIQAKVLLRLHHRSGPSLQPTRCLKIISHKNSQATVLKSHTQDSWKVANPHKLLYAKVWRRLV